MKIVKENLNDDWSHKVRVDIYEKTKNMFRHEFYAYFRKSAEEATKKCGFTILETCTSKDNDKRQKNKFYCNQIPK